MVIDSSALLAIALKEPEARAFVAAIQRDGTRLMSEVGWVESSMIVLHRKGEAALASLHRFVERAAIKRIAVDAHQGRFALDAFRRFGKGRHAASLNLGDCFAYGLAKALGEPILFKGRDFTRTDLVAVI